jgi:RHS repeat-associated protein
MSYPSTATYYVKVVTKAIAVPSYTLNGSKPDMPDLNLVLENGAGSVLATSTLTSGQAQRNLAYTVPAGTNTYRLHTSNTSPFAGAGVLDETHPKLDFADVGLSLTGPSGTVGSARTATGSLNLSRVTMPPEDYQWAVTNYSSDLPAPGFSLTHKVTKLGDGTAPGSFITTGTNPPHSFSSDGAGFAKVSVVWAAGSLGTANLTAVLKGPAGQVLGSATGTGSLSFTATSPGAGTHTVEVTNNSVYNVPSYTVTTTLPSDRPGDFTLQLKNSGGSVVATGSGTRPKSLTANVSPGSYTLVATATRGSGTATFGATYPARPYKSDIGYDGNDHATTFDDGTTTVVETLSPSGRPLRRVTKDSVTGAISEDVVTGYDDGSDSPAYTRPTAGGPVTTYLDAGGNLSAIDTAGAITYQHLNAHGDVVGTTDSAGAYTALPISDEFGVLDPQPGSRLSWLGGKQRSFVGIWRFVRLGQRIYDAGIGRFLQVDPVEGGSSNDYDYVSGDPINHWDLDGLKKCGWSLSCHISAHRKGLRRLAGGLATVAAGAALLTPAGWAVAGIGIAGAAAATAFAADAAVAALDCTGRNRKNCGLSATFLAVDAVSFGAAKYFGSARGVRAFGRGGALKLGKAAQLVFGVFSFGAAIGPTVASYGCRRQGYSSC